VNSSILRELDLMRFYQIFQRHHYAILMQTHAETYHINFVLRLVLLYHPVFPFWIVSDPFVILQ